MGVRQVVGRQSMAYVNGGRQDGIRRSNQSSMAELVIEGWIGLDLTRSSARSLARSSAWSIWLGCCLCQDSRVVTLLVVARFARPTIRD